MKIGPNVELFVGTTVIAAVWAVMFSLKAYFIPEPPPEFIYPTEPAPIEQHIWELTVSKGKIISHAQWYDLGQCELWRDVFKQYDYKAEPCYYIKWSERAL